MYLFPHNELYEKLLFSMQILYIGMYIYTCTHRNRRNEIDEAFWISRTPGYLKVFRRSLQLRDRGILLYIQCSKIKTALPACFDKNLVTYNQNRTKKDTFTTDLQLIPFYLTQGELKPMSLNFAVLTAYILP
jgi:hypothetical protein